MHTQSDIKKSTLEANYWWNRTEGYYHSYFSKMDQLHTDKALFDFFVNKIFQVFLSDYSVRRNIAAGENNVHMFVRELITSGFFHQVTSGSIEAIDLHSARIQQTTELSNKRQIRSLLSKVAFLINPSDFSLMDSYAKITLWENTNSGNKPPKSSLESYSCFIHYVNESIAANQTTFRDTNTILSQFEGTDAYSYFIQHTKAFHRRVFDKFLWLKVAESSGRSINNSGYKKALTFIQAHAKIS
jgi:hypothetical protein